MRTAFIRELLSIARVDDRVWLVCGDLGFSVLEPFAEEFPERFVNAGVAEQNMTALAAGIANEDKIVFTYSIANFPVMRCLEQIRNDVCYHEQNVKIVAVGGGLVYGSLGYSHFAIEDLAVLRVLPNMTVTAPGDPVEAALATRMAAETEGPVYLRLGRANDPVIHRTPPDLRFGKVLWLRPGRDVTLIGTGNVLDLLLEARNALARRGVSAAAVSCPFIKPFDTEAIVQAADLTNCIVTVEEHGPGGLGTIVSEILVQQRRAIAFRPVYLSGPPPKVAGSQAYLRAQYGLTVNRIVDVTLEAMKQKAS